MQCAAPMKTAEHPCSLVLQARGHNKLEMQDRHVMCNAIGALAAEQLPFLHASPQDPDPLGEHGFLLMPVQLTESKRCVLSSRFMCNHCQLSCQLPDFPHTLDWLAAELLPTLLPAAPYSHAWTAACLQITAWAGWGDSNQQRVFPLFAVMSGKMMD